MKFRFLFILCVIITQLSKGQVNYTQTIKGSVMDKEMHYPLAGATVKLYKDSVLVIGAKANENGEYKIEKIAIGRYTVKCSYIGYIEKQCRILN